MAAHDRIQYVAQLKKKQWSVPEECATHDKIETTDHILFQWPIAVFLWLFLRNTFGWPQSPTNCEEFLIEFVDNCRGKKSKSYLIHMCRCSVDHLEDPQTLTDGFVKSFAVIFVTFLVEWNVGYLEVSLCWSVSSKGERWGMLNSCVLVLICKTGNPSSRIIGVRYAFNKAEWMALI